MIDNKDNSIPKNCTVEYTLKPLSNIKTNVSDTMNSNSKRNEVPIKETKTFLNVLGEVIEIKQLNKTISDLKDQQQDF